jgi:iron(III) transport system permease protein
LIGLASSAFAGGTASFAAVVRDPLTRGYAVNSAVLGLAVVAIDLVLARVLAGRAVAGRKGVRPVDWPRTFPPLAIGVGFLALPWVLRMATDTLRGSGDGTKVGGMLVAFVDLLDPDRVPWVALIAAVALARLPLLARSAVERREGLRPSRLDAAITLGATGRQSRRTLSGRVLGVSPSAALLTLALAATSVTPALLLSPTAETRPVGPAVLVLIDEPGGGFGRASALAVVAVALNLGALAVASRGRSGLVREWFRG